MSFFGLFGRKQKSQPITRPERKVTPAREQPGPVSAKEALALALMQVEKFDSRYVLTMVTTGDVNERGLGYTWDFLFDFPDRAASGVFTVRACDSNDDEDIDNLPLCVESSVNPQPSRRQSTSLPLDFIDSPLTVQAMTEQGANFISGPSDMPLSTMLSAQGKPVWVTYMYDQEFQSPFSQ